jgi:hypothetical protein
LRLTSSFLLLLLVFGSTLFLICKWISIQLLGFSGSVLTRYGYVLDGSKITENGREPNAVLQRKKERASTKYSGHTYLATFTHDRTIRTYLQSMSFVVKKSPVARLQHEVLSEQLNKSLSRRRDLVRNHFCTTDHSTD